MSTSDPFDQFPLLRPLGILVSIPVGGALVTHTHWYDGDPWVGLHPLTSPELFCQRVRGWDGQDGDPVTCTRYVPSQDVHKVWLGSCTNRLIVFADAPVRRRKTPAQQIRG